MRKGVEKMKVISQEQYETFKKHYQLIYKNVQISEYDISNRLNPTELKQVRGYLDSGIWYNENQRINQENDNDACVCYVIRKETNEIIKQVKTVWEVVDFINQEIPCNLLEW